MLYGDARPLIGIVHGLRVELDELVYETYGFWRNIAEEEYVSVRLWWCSQSFENLSEEFLKYHDEFVTGLPRVGNVDVEHS
jgi:hypothetical protein